MKTFFRSIVILNTIIFSVGFFNDAMSQIQFQKTFGGSQDEYGYTTEQLDDGGYIMCGRAISFGVGGYDNYLIRFDANGDTLWTRTYGNVGYDEAQSIRQTTDGGFIMTGQTDNVDWAGDVYLVKTNADGIVSWSTAFGGATKSDFGYAVRQTADGGYIISGLSATAGSGDRDMLLIKTTSTGTLTWSKTYGGASGDEARSVEQTSDGGYIMCGFTQSYNNGYQMYVIKTNSLGVVSWSKTIGGGSMELGYSVKETSTGEFIVLGYTDGYGAGGVDVALVKLSAAGAVAWSKTYGGSGDDYGLSLTIAADGGYAIAGRTSSYGAGGGDYYLIKTNSEGVHQWSKAYGGSTLDQAGNIRQTNDGGFLLTGITTSFGAGLRDAFIVKTDASGNSGCSEVTATTQTNSPTITSGTGHTEGLGLTTVSPVTATRRTPTTLTINCSGGSVICEVIADFTTSDLSVCNGETIILTNTSTNATSYQWKKNGVQISSSDNLSYTSTEPGDFIFRLIAIDGDCKDSTEVVVTINALPNAVIVADGPLSFCSGETVNLSASAGASYLWSNDEQTQSVVISEEGQYSVEVTDQNQCSNFSDPVNVVVHDNPTVTITTTDSEFCLIDPAVQLSATPSGGQWSGTGVMNNMFDPGAAGVGGHTITYSFTDSNDCSGEDEIDLTVIICADINDLVTEESTIELFPNPAQNEISISWSNNNNVEWLQITDTQGRIVYNTGTTGRYKIVVPINDLSSGVYIVELTGTISESKKFVKE